MDNDTHCSTDMHLVTDYAETFVTNFTKSVILTLYQPSELVSKGPIWISMIGVVPKSFLYSEKKISALFETRKLFLLLKWKIWNQFNLCYNKSNITLTDPTLYTGSDSFWPTSYDSGYLE